MSTSCLETYISYTKRVAWAIKWYEYTLHKVRIVIDDSSNFTTMAIFLFQG